MEVLNGDTYRQFDIENWTEDLLFARNEMASSNNLSLFQSCVCLDMILSFISYK